mmetsp:Transcript_19135/g.41726  ORF Transcript_19135/g.41726 Transcript_19135/m.41726 type:complete len:519 (-) Transcript_19135:193-1749(-)
MDNYNRSIIIGLGLMLVAPNQSNHQVIAASASSASSLVNSNTHQTFADELTTNLYTNTNECSSALGISMAFSLIYPGCTGEAIDQLRNVFGYPNDPNDSNNNNIMQLVWEDTINRMQNKSAGQCPGGRWNGECDSEAPTLKIANSIWFDDNSTLHQNYNNVVGRYAKQIDLASDDSPIIVNEWVKNSTNGMIESIVPEDRPLFPPHELIAINSIYLKASWKHPFREAMTNLDSFYGSIARDVEVSKAHFMNGVFDSLNYSHDALPGYQIVQLPFASSQMSMIIVLPMSDAIGPSTSSNVISALNDLQSTRVALSIPKFKFESTYDDTLKSALHQTGIIAPFTGGSLCGLFQDAKYCDSLYVDKVIQKTVIDVHEIGIEAAAVTAILLGRSAPVFSEEPVLMMCNRPFQFFVYDGEEGLVLFEGRVGEPAVPEGEGPVVPLLDSKHEESDFWSKAFYVSPVDPVDSSPANDNMLVNGKEVDSSEAEPNSLSSNRGFVSFKKCCTLILGAFLGFVLGLLL